MGKKVGEGKFGEVYLCKHKKTGIIYAIKKILKSAIQERKMVDQFINELKIHYKMKHPNIIKLLTHFDDPYHIFMLLEYGEGSTLMKYLKSSERTTSHILKQVISAVQYMH